MCLEIKLLKYCSCLVIGTFSLLCNSASDAVVVVSLYASLRLMGQNYECYE